MDGEESGNDARAKKPNQINDKRRKSSTGQHVAHVRGAHDGLD
ncbi:hypothetical protein [Delftia sp. S67]|nr:hypothetical protein [Delftia sp. S67]